MIKILSLVKKFYKLAIFLVLVVSFFYIYNSVIVDRSLINLKVALAQAAEAKTLEDFQRIKLVLKMPILSEISRKDISSRQVIALELAENITVSDNLNLAKDISFYLKEAIKVRQAQRPGMLSFLDDINALLFKPSKAVPEKNIKAKISSLIVKIKSTKDKALLQELHYELANYYLQLQDYAKAEDAFLEVVNIEPFAKLAARSRFNLGWLYKITGRTEEAIDCFSKLSQEFIDKDRDFSVACQYQIADALYKISDFNKSRNLYAKLAEDNPDFKSTDFGLLESGNISLYKLADIKAATAFLEAFSLYRQGKDSSLPLKAAMEYIQASAAALEESKEAKAAAEGQGYGAPILKKGEKLKSNGFELLRLGKYSEAVDAFKEALKLLPRDGVSHSGLSLGYYWLKQDMPALEEARRAVELTPTDELTVANAMYVFINMGLPNEAVDAGERLISQRSAIKRPQVYYNLGYAYVLLRKIDEGITYFRNAIRLDPDFVFAMNNLGVILWSQQKFEEAIRLLLEVVARKPGYADAHYNLGAIYMNMRRMEEAYREFELVLDIDPDYKDVKHYMDFITNYLKQR